MMFWKRKPEPCTRSHLDQLDPLLLVGSLTGIRVIMSSSLPTSTMMVSKDLADAIERARVVEVQ